MLGFLFNQMQSYLHQEIGLKIEQIKKQKKNSGSLGSFLELGVKYSNLLNNSPMAWDNVVNAPASPKQWRSFVIISFLKSSRKKWALGLTNVLLFLILPKL